MHRDQVFGNKFPPFLSTVRNNEFEYQYSLKKVGFSYSSAVISINYLFYLISFYFIFMSVDCVNIPG